MTTVKRALVCIACPIGCHLEAEVGATGGVLVTGNKCERGEAYATAELVDPRRVVTATCPTVPPGGMRLPVKTDQAIAIGQIAALLTAIYACRVSLPVQRGQIVIPDFQGTGVNVIATRSL